MMSTTEGLPLPDLRGDRCNGCGSPTAWEENSGLCPRCSTPAGKGPAPPLTPGLIRGAAAPFRGLRFLGKHPRLWAWVVIPLLLNTLLFAFAMVWTVKNLGEFMPDFEQEWPALFDWARVTLGWLLQVLLYIVGVLAAFLATLLLASVVNSPFYDLLSEKVEATKLGREDPGRPWSALPMDSLLSLKAALSIALRQALVMLVLFPLSFTAFGAPLFALAGFYYAGLAQIDVTLARKLYPGSRRTRWSRRHWGLVLGAGLPLSLLPLLAPFATVGTTLAFLEEPDKQ